MSVGGPSVLQRSPRIVRESPAGEIEIPQPPPVPTPSSHSLVPIVLGGSGTMISLLMMLLMNRSGSRLMYGAYSIVGLLSLGYSLYTYVTQRRAYRLAVQSRTDKYRSLLDAIRRDLDHLRGLQGQALVQTDPSPAECARRIRDLDSRLWERSPADPDFLDLRLGTGSAAASFRIKIARQPPLAEPDPLQQAAEQLADEYRQVAGAPVLLPLDKVAAAGLVGDRGAVLATVRALVLQLATHHAPAELKVAVLFPEAERSQWLWMRWLPHSWGEGRRQRFLAMDRAGATQLLNQIQELASRRARLAALNQGPAPAQPPLPHLVLIVADRSLVEKHPCIPLLLTEGKSLGASVLILADRREELPQECQAIAELSPRPQLIQIGTARAHCFFGPDSLTVELAEEAARTMAPLRDRQLTVSAEIPRSVALLQLLGVTRVEALDVLSMWQSSEPNRSMAAPVGVRAGGEPLLLDLHERGHGPHGLVAGATGSGKSELLQSIIATLAVSFHPHEVVFVLVDYKGGGMANVFAAMPHLVGTITNLQGNLAARALSALQGELRRRQRMLAGANVSHIDDYQSARRKGAPLDPLPHLILIVDEFAELKVDQPAFMRELISAVRVGRSLGVHLILATQKPAGVVDDQIWSNTRFRLCLRVERPEDSNEVLKRPDAASIVGAGRGYCQVGNNEFYELFQAAWGGAPYSPGQDAAGDPLAVVAVGLDGHRITLGNTPEQSVDASATQLQALMTYLGTVARVAGIERLPGPWLPPLAERVTLEEAAPPEGWDGQCWQPVNRWLEPVVGLLDDPLNQRQNPLRLDLGKDGHLVVYGGPGSGKTTFLYTLITALATAHSPRDLHMYLLDFGGRTLRLFSKLPHVSAVVLRDEAERVERLFRFLLQELERRKELLAQAGVSTLAAYRKTAADPLPALVVILDNYAGFTESFGDREEALVVIAREGGNLGIHLALTAHSSSTIRSKIAGSISAVLALQMSDRSEYGAVIGRTGGMEPGPFEGRGLVRATPPLEFQTALPVPAGDEAELSASLKAFVNRMDEAWTGPRPAPIRVLPDEIALSDLAEAVGVAREGGSRSACVGMEVEGLTPFAIDLDDGPAFLLSGPMQSGKTTALKTWLLSLAAANHRDRLWLYLLDFQGGLEPLQRLPHVRRYVPTPDRVAEAMGEIAEALQTRRQALEAAIQNASGGLNRTTYLADCPVILVAVDDFDSFPEGAQAELEQLLRRERGMGFYLLMAGSSGSLNTSWVPLIKALKESQTGVLLGSSDSSDLQLFNARVQSAPRTLPPGQGYYLRRGRVTKVKFATPHSAANTAAGWVDRIIRGEGGLP